MEAHCIDVERIGEITDLPTDHPDRQHAESCPRCRSLVGMYVEFMSAQPLEGSGLEQARRVLDARIREAAERWIPAPTRSLRLARAPWWRGLLRPAPLFAAATILVAAVALFTSRGPQESVLRDDAPVSHVFAPAPARIDADGNIALSWTPLPTADAYEVRIYGPDLSEVYRHPATAETSAFIPRSTLPADLPASLDLTWRVYALSGGDVIEAAAPGSIRTP
ncbi:MAG: hypothetical protein L0Z51_01525 [Candidatus Latescibacteria bacterium]|nr:hypothetical protein [Candidatus Latescibacterota bacterium]